MVVYKQSQERWKTRITDILKKTENMVSQERERELKPLQLLEMRFYDVRCYWNPLDDKCTLQVMRISNAISDAVDLCLQLERYKTFIFHSVKPIGENNGEPRGSDL